MNKVTDEAIRKYVNWRYQKEYIKKYNKKIECKEKQK